MIWLKATRCQQVLDWKKACEQQHKLTRNADVSHTPSIQIITYIHSNAAVEKLLSKVS